MLQQKKFWLCIFSFDHVPNVVPRLLLTCGGKCLLIGSASSSPSGSARKLSVGHSNFMPITCSAILSQLHYCAMTVLRHRGVQAAPLAHRGQGVYALVSTAAPRQLEPACVSDVGWKHPSCCGNCFQELGLQRVHVFWSLHLQPCVIINTPAVDVVLPLARYCSGRFAPSVRQVNTGTVW